MSAALRLERRKDGVASIVVDVPGKTVNTLGADFAEQFTALLDEIEASDDVRAVVLCSGKADGFIAGADIDLLEQLDQADRAAELCRSGQRVLARLHDSRIPAVAAIHGACLGGGLEVALACAGRVASSAPVTKLGLPEVQLGLLPGLGGTQRLPRLVGLEAALDLLLTGKQIDARRALRMGLVDEVVPNAILVDVAAQRALALADGRARRASKIVRVFRNLREKVPSSFSDNVLGRKIVLDTAQRRLLRKTRHNYPAPERILEVVRHGLERGMERGLDAEARAFGELIITPQARQLINLFQATQELKKEFAPAAGAEQDPIRQVGVVGAGLMGSGITYVTAAVAGIPVRLRDKEPAAIAAGLRSVRAILDERVRRRRVNATERDLVLARITEALDFSGFVKADIVIEAVFEDLALKHTVLREAQRYGHDRQIFASNTSSLPISSIAEASDRPERVIGMHYFSPVHKMPLLELVVTPRTADWVIRRAVELGRRQGKTVIVVNDGVGFYTTRILSSYLNEAAFLLSEGVAVDRIDRALVDWGFPVGPLMLLDEVGIDVGEKVGSVMANAFGERHAPPPGMDKLIADGRLGRKNGRGFYVYDRSGKDQTRVDPSVYGTLGVEPSSDMSGDEIAERCALAMINEAVFCLDEDVLRCARDGDVGAVFGLGFPPFRGGPFRHADSVSAAEIVRRLSFYELRHGRRFAPAQGLLARAENGGHFYDTRRPVRDLEPRSIVA